jgi:UDP-GlcNAc3NAcA epimerase
VKIATILGTRPQFIKAAVVSRAIAGYNEKKSSPRIREVIVHTGQHYDFNMSGVFFEEMCIPPPHYRLGVCGGPHGAMTGRMLEKVEEVLIQEKPDAVLVYGDTNSTLAGALAAAKLCVPVAHVEAGLRSFNMRMPEEINRILTDRISSWLFCPTENAVANIQKERLLSNNKPGINTGKKYPEPLISNVGDVMYDASVFYRRIARPTYTVASLMENLKGGFYLATVHRAENVDSLDRLSSIISALETISETVPVVLPLHPRTGKALKNTGILLRNIILTGPASYFDMIMLISNCRGVFTDSGGLQKEAYFFHKPCITLRDETEWVELVECGFNTLAGADRESILLAERKIGAQKIDFSKALYGSGDAGHKIVEILSGNNL